MRVLVTFAVDAEFAPWRKLRDFAVASRNDLTMFSTNIGGVDVNVLLTGVRDKSASMLGLQMSALDAGAQYDVCISSGLSGALRPEHETGEVLVAKQVRPTSADADTQTSFLRCDEELVAVAQACGAKVVGSFYTADHIVITAEEKAKLSSAADAVEMESFGVIKEAYAWGTKAVAIRAISDGANQDLPVDFNRAVTDKGDVSLGRMIGQALRRPNSVPGLLKFGKQSHHAAEALAAFLERYIPRLAKEDEAAVVHGKAVQA